VVDLWVALILCVSTLGVFAPDPAWRDSTWEVVAPHLTPIFALAVPVPDLQMMRMRVKNK